MSNNQQKEGEKNSVRLLIQKLQDVKYKTSTLLCSGNGWWYENMEQETIKNELYVWKRNK